jgi:hypothetical protein
MDPAEGTWRRDSFTGDFERQVKEGTGGGASLYGGSEKGTWRGAPLLGTYKDMQKKKAMVTGISMGELGRWTSSGT